VGIGAFPTSVPTGPNILIWEHCGRGVGEQWVGVGEQWVSPVVHVGRLRSTLTLLYLMYRLVPSNRCSQCWPTDWKQEPSLSHQSVTRNG